MGADDGPGATGLSGPAGAFTPNAGGSQDIFLGRQGLSIPLPLITRAEGVYMWGENGTRYMDMSSGPIVSNIGHGVASVGEAIKNQIDTLDSVSLFKKPVKDGDGQFAAQLSDETPELRTENARSGSGAENSTGTSSATEGTIAYQGGDGQGGGEGWTGSNPISGDADPGNVRPDSGSGYPARSRSGDSIAHQGGGETTVAQLSDETPELRTENAQSGSATEGTIAHQSDEWEVPLGLEIDADGNAGARTVRESGILEEKTADDDFLDQLDLCNTASRRTPE